MEDSKTGDSDKLSVFHSSGIYPLEGPNAIFVDPIRVLNRCYTRFRVSPSSYYSRLFEPNRHDQEPKAPSDSRKRKRKVKKPRTLNEREQVADRRHQEVRPLLVKAHESLLESNYLLAVLCSLRSDDCCSAECGGNMSPTVEQSFLELGQVWQAPLYEIALSFHHNKKTNEDRDSSVVQESEKRVLPIFDNLVVNETKDDVDAEFLNNQYIIPRESCFYMSDLGKIHNLIPDEPDSGFNLIVVDPPWENGSAYQKSRYPTLPNRYFLSLPIKQLAHRSGALVALWVTNREKLRNFVVEELLPAWGVQYVAAFYWLKVKADGSLISDLDLFHHRPYECLLLGYCHGEDMDSKNMEGLKPIQDNRVILSIPGDYSRKPPIELLKEYVPGAEPARGIELFAREMTAGWVSWGNEPLHFQDSKYFQRK